MIVLKLKRGPAELDLNDIDNFMPGMDLRPPPAAIVPAALAGSDPWRGASVDEHEPAGLHGWDFSLHVRGGSEAEVKYNIALVDWFIRSGTRREPVVVVMSGNDDVPAEPLWGEYGGYIRYQVITGSVVPTEYVVGGIRDEALPDCRVSLSLAPVAEGKEMISASAVGWVRENPGANGFSSGLSILPSTTNLCINSSFEVNTTGWTGSNVTISRLTQHAVYGSYALKCLRTAGADAYVTTALITGITAGNAYTCSLDCFVESASASCNVIRLEWFTAADAYISTSSGGQVTTASVGSSSRLTFTVTAPATTAKVAIRINMQDLSANNVIYVDGVLLFYAGVQYNLPYFDGDSLGCAWTGTAHGSSSTSTAGRVRIPNTNNGTVNPGAWTMRMIWTPSEDNTLGADRVLWLTSATGIYVSHKSADDKFYMTDNINTIATAAQTFAAGTPMILYFTGSPAGGMAIYVNGAPAATGSYTPIATPSYVYIGSNDALSQHAAGVVNNFSIYDFALSSTQVANDYNNIRRVVESGRRLGHIPWWWTKDGDNILDNCDDTGRDNWAVAGGVPGSLPARTRWTITPSALSKAAYWLMSADVPVDDFVLPTAPQWYEDMGGTADVGNASGDAYQAVTMSGSGSNYTYDYLVVKKPYLIEGKLHFFTRLKVTSGSATFDLQPWVALGLGSLFFGERRAITVGTTYQWFYAGSMSIQYSVEVDLQKQLVAGIQLVYSGLSHTAAVDYIMVINGRVMRIYGNTGGGWTRLHIAGTTAAIIDADEHLMQTLDTRGPAVDLLPERLNLVWFVLGDHDEDHAHTSTATLTPYVTPRYALL